MILINQNFFPTKKLNKSEYAYVSTNQLFKDTIFLNFKTFPEEYNDVTKKL